MGRVLGGWTFAPIFAAGTGYPLPCGTNSGGSFAAGLADSQSFGAGDSTNFFTNANCVNTVPINFGTSAHLGVNGGTDTFGNDIASATAGTGNAAVNIFADPVAAFGAFRAPILGIDVKNPGNGSVRGMPYWNMDLSIKKNIRVSERFSLELQSVFSNVLNHNQFANPTLDLADPTSWGVINSQINPPRSMEFGIRLNF